MSTVMTEELHSTLQHSMVTLTFVGSYLSAVWRLMHGMKADLPHFSWHHNMDTSMLCGYCSTTMQIQMSTVMMEEPHSILQHSMATLTFLGSYLSAVQRLMHRMKINLPHLPWHQNMDTSTLCSYCSTTMQLQMSTPMMGELHFTLQHAMVTSTFVGSYLSAVWRSTHGMYINLPHFSWRQNLGTSMLCDYCSTAMQMWKRVTTTVTPRCFVQHSIVNRRLYKYYWTEMRRSTCGEVAVLLHYTSHHRVRWISQKDIRNLCSFWLTMVRTRDCVIWREGLHPR